MVTLQHRFEIDQLVNLARSAKPTAILELGCWDGGTLMEWVSIAPRVVAIDDVCRFENDWYREAQGRECELHVFKGLTRDASIIDRARALGPYDLVFVDADHSAEAVAADFATYREMVASGGMIAFHDIRQSDSRPDLEVWTVWDAIRAETDSRTVEIHANLEDWGGIGVVFV